jgi:hypothetical protein
MSIHSLSLTGDVSAAFPLLFDQPPPDPRLRLSVIVPARNEADHLPATLDALRQQTDPAGHPLDPRTYEVLLLLNNCTDASVVVATRYARLHPDFRLQVTHISLPPERANVGTVRRLLMDEACRRLLTVTGPAGIITSTDGDTVVAPDWLWQTEQEIGRGCEAVGGRILTRPDTDTDPAIRLWHLRDVTYRSLLARAEAALDPCPHDPWPRHFQHFGASLAVTCGAYLRAGRLPKVPHLEDEALYRALLRVDARVRKSPTVRVFTSARLAGRVAVGFSEQLRHWAGQNQAGCEQMVPSVPAALRLFRARQHLRRAWAESENTPGLMAANRLLDLNPVWLAYQLADCGYFGQVWERVEAELQQTNWFSQWPAQPIDEAIAALRSFTQRPDLSSWPGEEVEPVGRLALMVEVM